MSNSRSAPEQPPTERTSNTHVQTDVWCIFYLRDRKLKYCGTSRFAGESGTEGATLVTAMLEAHATIASYLLARIDAARGVPARHVRREALVREEDAQRAIRHVVRNFRARGARPEYLLIRFKELLATLPRHDYDVWDAVRQQTIQWVIEEYYRCT